MLSLLSLSLFTVAAPLPAPRSPDGPAPRVEVVQVDDAGRPFLDGSRTGIRTRTVYESVPIITEVTDPKTQQKINSVEYTTVAVQEPYKAPLPVYLDTREVQVFGLDGKRMEPAEVLKLLSKSTRVLVSADGKPVARAHLEAHREATFSVVSPELVRAAAGPKAWLAPGGNDPEPELIPVVTQGK